MATWEGRLPSLSASHAQLAVVLALLVALTLPASYGADAATGFTASDIAVTSPNGQLETLTVAPTGELSFVGLDTTPTSATIAVQIDDPNSGWVTIATMTKSISTSEGTLTYGFSQLSILDTLSYTATDFESTQNGESTTTTVGIKVIATIQDGAGQNTEVSTSSATTFDVTVTKDPGQPGGSGAGTPGRNGGGTPA